MIFTEVSKHIKRNIFDVSKLIDLFQQNNLGFKFLDIQTSLSGGKETLYLHLIAHK